LYVHGSTRGRTHQERDTTDADRLQPAVEKSELLTLKAIWSRSLKSAQATHDLATKSKPDLYSSDSGDDKSFEALLKRDDIAAVILALPITNQPKYIEAALTAGKHVLAEKPIGPDVAAGKKLIEFYKKTAADKGLNFSIAENFRFIPSITYAAEQAAKLGKVEHFSARVLGLMDKDNKYYKTAWRATPEYQGGFLLDGGVHFAAATRLFLTSESKPATVSAFTSLAQEHLPPIDSVFGIVKTKSGGVGSYQQSAGSHLSAFEWDIGSEGGRVFLSGSKVTVKPVGGEESVKEFEKTSGVSEEVAAWAEALKSGKPNPLQSPEEALADLEFLEKMFRSGEQDGALQTYELQ
jgi:predicted dehydrogenase